MQWMLPNYELMTPVTKATSWQVAAGAENDEWGNIQWYPLHGLHGLLHEVGHAKYRHSRTSDTQRGTELLQEAQAWLFSEHWCKKLGIKFDYKDADTSFGSYFRRKRRKGGRGKVGRQLVVVNWRFKSGTSMVRPMGPG